MTTATIERTAVSETLDWVNEWRSERDLPELAELPTGCRLNSGLCPVANAMSTGGFWASVGPYYITTGLGERWGEPKEQIPTPDYIREFIADFDHGKYPEYLEG